MEQKLKRKRTILIVVMALVALALTFFIVKVVVPAVVKYNTEQRLRWQIAVLEKKKELVNGEINQLSLDRQKCEDLQKTTNEQAQGKRGEIAKMETEIAQLQTEYNTIAGFTSGL